MNNKIEELRQVLTNKYLVKAKKSGYVCPICNSGTGKNGTGIMTKDNIHFTCFANNCFSNADIIDIVAIAENIPEETKIKDLMNRYGIESSPDYKKKRITPDRQPEQPKIDTKELELLNKSLQNKEQAIDFLNTYRGISKEYLQTLDNIGYYQDTTNKFNNNYLTIKTADDSFIRRNTDTKSNFRFKNYGTNRPSKLELLKNQEPVIVVESYIDLMSLESIGYKAISLNSVANYSAFVDYIEQNKKDIKATIILCLDNDQPGKDSTEIIKQRLEKINIKDKLNIKYYNGTDKILSYTGQQYIKDINDLLKVNTEILKANIENTIVAVDTEQQEEFEKKKREWEKDKVINYLPEFVRNIEEQTTNNCTPTGFKHLDNILDGGLYPGLYTIGAISSLGKTNFILQMSDQIAQAGNQVLYFSLEMSKAELIARSISRLSYQETNINRLPKTTREILKFKNYEYYTEEQKAYINKMIHYYGNFAGNININEGIGNIGTEFIGNKIKEYIYFKGKAPVVFIDYLQLLALAPQETVVDIRQITDKNILELKRLSRDYNTPIVVVSSFNRDNYSKTANMGAFKESGAIEYSSDVLISLEYKVGKSKKKGQDIIDLAKEEYKEKGHNEILLKVLKNRNGIRDNADYTMNGAYSIFTEI